MIRKEAVKGMHQEKIPRKGNDCEHCVRGKMIRLSLKHRAHKEKTRGSYLR